jgi:hypothetical protein
MYFWNNYPEMRGLFFRIKNEDHNAITGARNKATGVIPGVADSCLLWRGTAVFIEFKTETGRQSEVQKAWSELVSVSGYQYFIIRTLDEFKSLCHQLGL